MTWREEWEEAKNLTGEEFFAKYGKYKWNLGYYEGLARAEEIVNKTNIEDIFKDNRHDD